MLNANSKPYALAVAVTVVLAVVWFSHGFAQEDPDEQNPAARGAVVLELFTSQGCSSCPAADRLLMRLGTQQMVDGVSVIPLAFHVDYWNYIGWTDPFSSSEWSERQRRYALVFDLASIYTPQLVINGRHEVVGSDARRVRQAIPRAAVPGSAAQIELAIEPESLAGGPLRIALRAQVEEYLGADRVHAMLAVFENGLVTPVGSGENARKTLHNEFVVRRLSKAFELPGNAGSVQKRAVDVALDPDWARSNLGIATFLQDPESLEIHGASAIFLKDFL